jgi:RimJ/RimL family protein N-acetyltransferase
MADDSEARAWIAGWAARWAAETDASWAVTGQDDKPLGQVGLRELSLFEAAAEVSYWVLPNARGASIAVRATQAMTQWAFGTLRLNRLLLQHSTQNHASCRVAHKTGYAVEGIRRRAQRHTDGWHDMHTHARLADS